MLDGKVNKADLKAKIESLGGNVGKKVATDTAAVISVEGKVKFGVKAMVIKRSRNFEDRKFEWKQSLSAEESFFRKSFFLGQVMKS